MALRCSTFQLRPQWWWVTLESNQAGTKAQALQARSVPRLGVTRIGCGERYPNARLVVMSHGRGVVTAPVIPRKGAERCKRLSGAGVRPAWHDRSWRRAEDLSLTPFGAIGVRSRAGAPVRLTLQHWDDASSNRHPNLSSCLSMISAQTRSAFVARENRCPLFRIML